MIQPFQPRHLGGVKIIQRAAERPHRCRLPVQIQFGQAVRMKMRQHPVAADAFVKRRILAHIQRDPQPVFHKAGHHRLRRRRGIQQQLARHKAPHFVGHPQRHIRTGQRGGANVAGGAIAQTQPRCAAVRRHIQSAQIVVLFLIQHAALDHGAGGDDADHIALDQPLRGGGILHLLADGDLVAARHQLGNIRFVAVERHPAHGGALLLSAVAAGQYQLQLLRGDFRVFVEHLVKVAQPEKQQTLRILLFNLKILLHHRR